MMGIYDTFGFSLLKIIRSHILCLCLNDIACLIYLLCFSGGKLLEYRFIIDASSYMLQFTLFLGLVFIDRPFVS